MAIPTPHEVIISNDPPVTQQSIAVTSANNDVYVFETTKDIYVTAIQQQYDQYYVTNIVNRVAGRSNGEIQFKGGSSFDSSAALTYGNNILATPILRVDNIIYANGEQFVFSDYSNANVANFLSNEDGFTGDIGGVVDGVFYGPGNVYIQGFLHVGNSINVTTATGDETFGQFEADVDAAAFLDLYNANGGSNASTDFSLSNDLTNDVESYINIGITGSAFVANSDINNPFYVHKSGDSYAYSLGATGNTGVQVAAGAIASQTIQVRSPADTDITQAVYPGLVFWFASDPANVFTVNNLTVSEQGNTATINIDSPATVVALEYLESPVFDGNFVIGAWTTPNSLVKIGAAPEEIGDTLTSPTVRDSQIVLTIGNRYANFDHPVTFNTANIDDPDAVVTTPIITIGNGNIVTASNTVADFSNSEVSLSISNLTIPGGSNGYVITTDGAGNLTWGASGSGGSNVIQDGNSNVVVTENSNVIISVNGVAAVATFSSDGLTVASNLAASNAAVEALSANTVSANSATISGNLTSANIAGGNTVAANYLTGTLTTALQPNITSVGNLSSLTVTGNISSGNSNLGNAARANFFIGSGANLSNIVAANIVGTVANANYSLYAGTVTTNAQPNITSVGTLTSATVSGTLTVANTGTANLAGGALINVNNANITSANLNIVDKRPFIGSGAASDGDAGILVKWGAAGGTTGFVGYSVANSAFILASNATDTGSGITVGNLGDLRAANIVAVGANVTANYIIANTIQDANLSNVGWTANNRRVIINASTSTTANYTLTLPVGVGNAGEVLTTNGTGALSWQPVGNGTFTGPVVATTLTATGNVSFTASPSVTLGSNANLHITGGSNGQLLSTDGTGNLSWVNPASSPTQVVNGSSNIVIGANANIAFAVAGTSNVLSIQSSDANSSNSVIYANARLEVETQPGITQFATLIGSANNSLFMDLYNTNDGSNASADITISNDNNAFIDIGVVSSNFQSVSSPLWQPNDTYLLTYPGNTGSSNLVIGAFDANSSVKIGAGGAYSNLSEDDIRITVSESGIVLSGNTTLDATLVSSNNATIINFANTANVTLGSNSNVRITGGSNGQYLQTDGNGGLSWSTVTSGTAYSNANVAAYLASNANIPITVGGNITTAANIYSGNADLGNLATANYFSGVLTTGAQPNITSVGTLTGLSVSGNTALSNVTASNASVANIAVSGNVTAVNVTATDNITANALIANISITSGNIQLYSNGAANVRTLTTTGDAVIGGNITVSRISATGNISTTASISASQNVSASNNFILSGAGSFFANGANIRTNNITVLSNLTAANATVTGRLSVTANTTFGSNVLVVGDLVSNGTIDANALISRTTINANAITANGQVTITGNVNLTNSPNVTLGNVANIHISGGSNLQFLQTDSNGTLTWADPTFLRWGTSNLSLANSGNLTANISGNVTLVVTGSNVNVTGNTNVANGNIDVGNSNLVIYANGNITGNNSALRIADGNTNITLVKNSNITLTVNGTSNVAVFSDTQVSIGNGAGTTSQSINAIAIGINAGQTTQSSSAIAIGLDAGQTSQGSSAIAIGNSAAISGQGSNAVAIGTGAGNSNQGANALALGTLAGNTGQLSNGIAIGTGAASNGQGINSIAIGSNAATTSQSANAVAIGQSAGSNTQAEFSIAVGPQAGYQSQGVSAIALGLSAGYQSQGSNSIAIGRTAANANQGLSAIAIGLSAASQNQGPNAIAIGANTAQENQGGNSIAIGRNITNNLGQWAVAVGGGSGGGANSVAIGPFAGGTANSVDAVYIGRSAGAFGSSANTIAIGANAGWLPQSPGGIAIGTFAASSGQGSNAIAIGTGAASATQGAFAIAIGANAASNTQGNFSIALGFNAGGDGSNNATAVDNSIILNASGNVLNATTSGLYVNPIRNQANNVANIVFYNATTSEVTYASSNTLSTIQYTGNVNTPNPIASTAEINSLLPVGTVAKSGDLFVDTDTRPNNTQPIYIFVNNQWRQLLTALGA